MDRISQQFIANNQSFKRCLIPFITAGYPKTEMTVPIMHTMVENGANIIELGIPFSDPMADGIEIQKANEKVLKKNFCLSQIFSMIEEFRKSNQETPIILMGYANPIECHGKKIFLQQAKSVGVDGILVVDRPPEADDGWNELCKKNGINQIMLIAPTTSKNREQLIINNASGFIYFVALKGITGSDDLDIDSVKKSVEQIKQKTKIPVVVGFGVKNAENAKKIAQFADGVVIGSKIINILSKSQSTNNHNLYDEIGRFIKDISTAIEQ